MTDQLKDSEIIESFRIAEKLTQASMARALDISRQGLHKYLHDVSAPAPEMVMNWFRNSKHDWVREMALEIFVRRPELERPCVCLKRIGDNGPCPRHSAVLESEA